MLEVRSLYNIENNPLGDFYEVIEINEQEHYAAYKCPDGQGGGKVDLDFAVLRFKNEDGSYFVFKLGSVTK